MVRRGTKFMQSYSRTVSGGYHRMEQKGPAGTPAGPFHAGSLRALLLLSLLLFGKFELRKAGTEQDVVPRNAFLDVGDMHPLAVVLGKHLGKEGLECLGRFAMADGLLAARVGIDAGEDLSQR